MLGLVLGLVLGLIPSSDIVLKSTVLSSLCVPIVGCGKWIFSVYVHTARGNQYWKVNENSKRNPNHWAGEIVGKNVKAVRWVCWNTVVQYNWPFPVHQGACCTCRRIPKATEGHRRLPKDDVREVESCLRYGTCTWQTTLMTVNSDGLSVVAKCRMLLIVLFKWRLALLNCTCILCRPNVLWLAALPWLWCSATFIVGYVFMGYMSNVCQETFFDYVCSF